MELVYLWVEEYKNIKKQGFSFSPRFRCEYDEDTKKLNIIDKEKTGEKYLKNFFGDNINITTIVGENGSGKSSVFEILAKINLDKNKIRSSYFYITNDNEKLSLYSKDIENIISTPTIKTEYSKSYDFELKTRNKSNNNVKVNFSNYFNLNYLNISHLEQDDIIENDTPLQGSKMNYYGIYSLNKFETDKKSILPIFGEFHLDRFNYYQTYTLSKLLIEKKYKDLFFSKLKIQVPYCIKLSYSRDELKKPHLEIPKGFVSFIEGLDEGIIKLEDSKLEDFFNRCSKIHNIEKYIKLTFKTDNGETIKFSTGQKTILFYLQKIDLMIDKIDKKKTSILLFDEIELYLHPNWQKRIFKIIIDFVEDNKLEKLIHIIITSHSPFILSDIPKENVIFLENGKQVYPDINPFGANIHTLLSNGFFMKDGLMGEFSKDKIKSIMKYHEEILKLELTKKENKIQKNTEKEKYEKEHKTMFWQIQSIIGDDYLKQVVKNHLIEIEKIVLGNDEANKEEVKRLKAQIELLEK